MLLPRQLKLAPLASALSLVLLSGCTVMSWEERYENVEKPLKEEYQKKAAALTSDVYNYRFQFLLEDSQDYAKNFTLHAHYAAGVADLAQVDKEALIKAVANLKDKPDIHINVIGHTDNRPLSPRLQNQFTDNQTLSAARAQQVAEFLREYLDLDTEAVSFTGMGSSQPVADNNDSAGRAKNRRVEINTDYQHPPQNLILSQSPEQDPELADLPSNFIPWWQPLVTGKIHPKSKPINVTLNDLLLRALHHSTQIRVFSDLPLIRQTMITEAEGKFDIHAFVEAKYAEINEPIGSSLRTGEDTETRFKEHAWQAEVGLRRNIVTGGEIEISQQFIGKDNNSRFFQPHDQGESRLMLTLRHRLLNGFGYEYNQSQIEIAKVDQAVSMDEFVRQSSAHLLEIERAYWGLYLERVNLLQKKKLFSQAEQIVAELKARRGIDVLVSQLEQAKAVLASRYAASIRSEQGVRNAESKILALVNDPELIMNSKFEMMTEQAPQHVPIETDVAKTAQLALQHRPEITQAFKQLKAGMVRSSMADSELLPALDIIFETTLKGLEGNYDILNSTGNQFTQGAPSWTLGLRLDWPLGNRIAKARQRRRELEVRQLVQQLRTTIETILLEVQVSVREINTAHKEMLSQYQAMQAMKSSLETLNARRHIELGSNGQGQFLQNLLDTQEDLALTEQYFLEGHIAYNVAKDNLDRAQGLYLEANNVEYVFEEEDNTDLPILRLKSKTDANQAQ